MLWVMKLDWWCKKFREDKNIFYHIYLLVKRNIVHVLAWIMYLENYVHPQSLWSVFCIVHFECIQISCSTAVSSHYTAAPRSPCLTLPPPISPLPLNITSKVFLGNTFFPLSSFFSTPLLLLVFSIHHSFSENTTFLLNQSPKPPLSTVHVVPNATFFKNVWSPLPPPHLTWFVLWAQHILPSIL